MFRYITTLMITISLLTNISFAEHKKTLLIQTAYWEQKPFIYNESNVTKGIMVDIMKNGKDHCHDESSNKLIEMVRVASSRKEYNQILQQNISTHFNDTILTLWGPVMLSSEASQDLMKMQPDHLLYQIMISKHMVVVVRRYRIELLYKTWQGLLNSSQVAIVTILTAICVGILIWFVERKRNPEISESFFKGAPTGIWCSLVTMTTVGYGDVVPKHFISRILISAWILLALSLAAILTATVSENVSGVSGIDINNQMVAVLSTCGKEGI
ncbi:putative potassium channel protein RPA4233 [Hydractinia symbiolongicarpus]|uniref:putative potassium channel protein RPA4233 n=1 Tax=Hydractinia symbiolongicarpus TaxID=13093 RepID=UPI00254F38D4|nr:putative potassium channel protein RPA4233 [Hydractinia symbiolongicarpus]